MNAAMNHENRVVSADLLDDIIDQFDGDDMATDLADDRAGNDVGGDDDHVRLSGGIGNDVLFCEA